MKNLSRFWFSLCVFCATGQSLWAESGEVLNLSNENQPHTETGEIILNENPPAGSGVILTETGAENIAESGSVVSNETGAVVLTQALFLNEILVNPTVGKEWVEIYNAGEMECDLTNFSLWDAVKSRYVFASGLKLPPKAFVTLEFSNVFNNSDDQIYLKNATGETVDWFIYGATGDFFQIIPKDKTIGRSPDGAENWLLFAENQASPNAPNFAYYNVILPTVSVNQTASGNLILSWEKITEADFQAYQISQNQAGSGWILLQKFTENSFVLQNSAQGQVAEYLLQACNQAGKCSSEANSQKILITDFLDLRINEFVANVSGKDDGLEWIEIFYAGSGGLVLDGYFLEIDGTKSIDLSGLRIEKYLLLNPWDFGATLKNTNGKIALKKFGIESVLEEFTYAEAREGMSWRRNLTTNLWEENLRLTPNAENIVWNTAPQAVLKLQGSGRTEGAGSLSLNVTAEDSWDADGDSVICFWDYGDGEFAYKCNPTAHQYGVGEFELKLTVRDDFGGMDFKTQRILVHPAKTSAVEEKNKPIFLNQKFSDEIKISAFLPNPVGKDDELEWIEIINTGKEKVSLDWWQIDDGEKGSKPYVIPLETSIAPQQILRFSVLNTKLALNNDQDAVRLFSPDLTLKDSVFYAKPKEGNLYRKGENGEWRWENADGEIILPEEVVLTETGALVLQEFDFNLIEINEILPSSSAGDKANEWIELYNRGDESYDLAGWKLDDILIGGSKPFVFPQNSFIPPRGFLIVDSAQSKLALNNDGDTVNLINSRGERQDFITYTQSAKDCSWAQNGKGRFLFSAFMTKGEANLLLPRALKIKQDQDQDGLADLDESNFYHTDFAKSDTDGDGVPDGFEVYNALEPLIPGESTLYTQYLQSRSKGELQTTEARKILIQGTTEPQALVKIYVHSKLVIGFAQADEKGNWQYEITDELEAGEHRIETEITTKNGFKIPKTELLNFQLEKNYKGQKLFTRVKINSILPNSVGNDQKGEYFEIRNFENKPINLLKWQIVNQKNQKFILPEIWLKPASSQKFYYADTKISLNNTQGSLTLLSPQGLRTDFLNYANAQEGEIFTHHSRVPLTKKSASPALKKLEYEMLFELQGVILAEIDPADCTVLFQTDAGQTLRVKFDPEKYPVAVMEFILQKGNKVFFKGEYLEQDLFLMSDFILLEQVSLWSEIQAFSIFQLNYWGLSFAFFLCLSLCTILRFMIHNKLPIAQLIGKN